MARCASTATSAFKKTTGLCGLPVHPNSKPELSSLYNRILHSLQQLPEQSAYRQSTHKLVSERLNIVATTEDIAAIEQKINAGQIEELIYQAEMELKLIPSIEKWKAHEALEVAPPSGQWQYFK
ncbi:hypothetical protein RTP6_006865 [Batrachochytrium dendrobatidis]